MHSQALYDMIYMLYFTLNPLKVVSTINHTIPAYNTKKPSIDGTCLVCELKIKMSLLYL